MPYSGIHAAPRQKMNVCAIRRKSDCRYWQSNMEHGSGWTDRIRQAWTYRDASLEVRALFERGWIESDSVEIVELQQNESPTHDPTNGAGKEGTP